jgi:hypothetical protein
MYQGAPIMQIEPQLSSYSVYMYKELTNLLSF